MNPIKSINLTVVGLGNRDSKDTIKGDTAAPRKIGFHGREGILS